MLSDLRDEDKYDMVTSECEEASLGVRPYITLTQYEILIPLKIKGMLFKSDIRWIQIC